MGRGNWYPKEFKEQAVAMLDGGTKTARQVEDELGIPHGQVHRWKREQNGGSLDVPVCGTGKSTDIELAALRIEVAQLREERDILRKANEPSSHGTPDDLPVHPRPEAVPARGDDGQATEGITQRVITHGKPGPRAPAAAMKGVFSRRYA